MKYQKEFEKFINDNPHLLGGNNLGIQTTNYGIPLPAPEYSASHVRHLYDEFEKFMERIDADELAVHWRRAKLFEERK